MGIYYFNNTEIDKNGELAYKWLTQAFKMNHPKAQMKLGVMYLEGRGTDVDALLSLKWLESAAAQKEGIAYYLMAKLLDDHHS